MATFLVVERVAVIVCGVAVGCVVAVAAVFLVGLF